jgi:hypothetical protein
MSGAETGQDEFLGAEIRRLQEMMKLKVAAIRNGLDRSCAGEFEFLNSIAVRLGIDRGFVVDVAAGDGFTQSCTFGFFRMGWTRLAVEMDPDRFATLACLYERFPGVKLAKSRITPGSITPLLEGFEVPRDFSMLNLDVDSYDLFVIDKMLGGRPKVVSMEINEKIPSGVYFTVNFDESQYGQGDHFFGCSVDAAAATVKPAGYILAAVEYNNAVFIREELAATKFVDLTPGTAYERGYRGRADRQALLPWNKDV